MLRWIVKMLLFRFLAKRFGPLALAAVVLAKVLPWERERREAQQAGTSSRRGAGFSV